jgi:hypothetical protein
LLDGTMDEISADESGAAGDQQPHRATLSG